jgi:O-acetylserine/cysteine efflux transporter
MRPLDIFFALLVATVWGGNFVAAKYGLEHFPPFFLTFLRFTLVAALLLPFVPRPGRRQMVAIAKISCLNTLHFSLPYLGMALGLSIASTAIVTQLGTPFSCLLGALFLHDKLGKWRIIGMALAFAGMMVVFGAPEIAGHMAGFFCALGAAFFWGSANVMLKFIKDAGMLQIMAWMSIFSVPQLLAISLIFEPGAWVTLTGVPLRAALAVAYSVVFSTLVGHGLWFYLLRKHPVSQVTPWSLLTPILGAAFGQIFFDEMLSTEVLIGGIITIMGVGIIVVRWPKFALLGRAT